MRYTTTTQHTVYGRLQTLTADESVGRKPREGRVWEQWAGGFRTEIRSEFGGGRGWAAVGGGISDRKWVRAWAPREGGSRGRDGVQSIRNEILRRMVGRVYANAAGKGPRRAGGYAAEIAAAGPARQPGRAAPDLG